MTSNKKNKEINHNNLVTVKPITDNQKLVFETWKKGKNQFLFGAAGTGKTFVSLYLALQDVMDLKKPYDKVVLVRSLIPTREIGFLPGDEEDKAALYQVPYQNMVQFMFEMQNEQQFNNLYDRLKGQGTLYFLSTSFLRGLTFDNSIIIVDECQNLNFHELDIWALAGGDELSQRLLNVGELFEPFIDSPLRNIELLILGIPLPLIINPINIFFVGVF